MKLEVIIMTSSIPNNSTLNCSIQGTNLPSSPKTRHVRIRTITPEMVKSQAKSDQVDVIRRDIHERITELREGKGPKQLLEIRDTIKSVKAACETMQSIGLSFKSELTQLNAIEKQLNTSLDEPAATTTSSSMSAAQIATKPTPEPERAEPTFPAATAPFARSIDLAPVKSLLAPVPKDGIKVGLPNIEEHGRFGNTCWLNTVLKFISCTHYYDKMLIDPPPKGMEKLQKMLTNIINDLRRGKCISNKTYCQFLKELKEQVLIPENFTLGATADAPEFLIKLTKRFAWTPSREKNDFAEIQKLNESGLYPREGQIYRSKTPGVEKYGFIENSQPNLEIELYKYANTRNEINLAENETGELEIRPDVAPQALMSQNQNFTIKKVFTCLPATLMLNLKRGVVNEYGQLSKVSNPLKLENGYITLTEYAPILNNQGGIVDMQPAYTCRYCIGASMTHGIGHFICEERTAKGTLYHNDNTVSELNDPLMGTKGYFIRLDLVDKTKIEPTKPLYGSA